MSRPEINMMFFGPYGVWHERQVRESMAEIKAHGADSVCSNVLEDLVPLHDVARFARAAKEAGLRFYAMPARVAGLFSAGPRLISPFLTAHPEARAEDPDGGPLIGDSGVAPCVVHPEFEKWFYPFIRQVVEACEADGILFDEPKTCCFACHCRECRARAGNDESALLDLRQQSYAEMLNRAAATVKEVNADSTALAMLMPATLPAFVEKLAAQPAVDVIGVDGPVRGHSGKKKSIFDSAPQFFETVRRHGKRTFALVESFEVTAADESLYDEQMPHVPELEADVTSFNYYGHGNEDPERVMRAVWAGMKAVAASN